jgi:trans-aconitate methyltransferase
MDPDIAADLLARWDRQQERYIAQREQRFDIIIEAVRKTCGGAPLVIDLCCGPGSLGRRLKAALPAATIWAVDADPVLQAIGAAAEQQLSWIERDLRRPGWSDFLDGRPVDAVVSTTALHWLDTPELLGVYRELAGIIRPGGIFLDGDHCPIPGALGQLAQALTEMLTARNNPEAEDWQRWWSAVRAIPALQQAAAKRDTIFATRAPERPPTVAFHVAALLDAGFAEAGPLWQIATDWVVAALR